MLTMLALAAFYYNRLPEAIPIHFNAKLEPDGWAGKSSILLLPVIAFVLYLLMNWSAKLSQKTDPATLRKWQSSYRGKSDAFIKKSVDFSIVQTSYINLYCQILFLAIFIHSLATAFEYHLPFAALIFWAITALIFVPVIKILWFHLTTKE